LQHYTAGEIQWQEINIPGQEDSIAHFCPCSPTAVIIAITAGNIQFDRSLPSISIFFLNQLTVNKDHQWQTFYKIQNRCT
jgi:hypothetical protein